MKYMRWYGLSVHETAALCIARRGQGFLERLPETLAKTLTSKARRMPCFKQWAKAYKITKGIRPVEMIQKSKPPYTAA